jgi:hypothetical protein
LRPFKGTDLICSVCIVVAASVRYRRRDRENDLSTSSEHTWSHRTSPPSSFRNCNRFFLHGRNVGGNLYEVRVKRQVFEPDFRKSGF